MPSRIAEGPACGRRLFFLGSRQRSARQAINQGRLQTLWDGETRSALHQHHTAARNEAKQVAFARTPVHQCYTKQTMTYVLHYAPDNASLIIRLALEHRGVPYRAQLVDRARAEQSSPGYRRLNPNGLIPVLETPQGPIFETGAILLWLADTHGGLGPAPKDLTRGAFLKWLFFASNTLHPTLRMLFYPEKYISPEHAGALRTGLKAQLQTAYTHLEAAAAETPDWFGATNPTILDFYTCAMIRWSALYPNGETDWFDLARYPNLKRLCAHIETLPATAALQTAEGLGSDPFTNPQPANPPQGSAT